MMTLKQAFFISSAAFLFCNNADAQIHRTQRDDSIAWERIYNLNPIVVTGSGHHQRLKSTATPVRMLSKREIE